MKLQLPPYRAWLLLTAMITVACQEPIAEEEFSTEGLSASTERGEDIELLYSDSAVLRVRVTGPVMLSHTDRSQLSQEFIDGVRVEFFNETGNLTSLLTAKYAIRYEKLGEVIVRDSVVWQSVQQEQLETSELIWNENKRQVYTNKFVVITRPQDTIFSRGFQADQNFRNMRFSAIDGVKEVEELTKDL